MGRYEDITLFLASSAEEELAALTGDLANELESRAPAGLTVHYVAMPDESHGTIYHPAALAAFRQLFAPAPK